MENSAVTLLTSILLGLVVLSSAATTRKIADHEPPKFMHDGLAPRIPESELTSAFWNDVAKDLLKSKTEELLNTGRAKNVIMFLGDGMSIPTLAAARIYMGQLYGQLGESTPLSFELFPVAGLSKTYCVDHQVADSACTATAYLGGVKTNNGMIGLTANITRGVCQDGNYEGNLVESIALRAIRAGKEAGIVTTTQLTDASPAGAYGHVAERGWESDADLPEGADPGQCWDLAKQLVLQQPGKSFKVILGGGKKQFLPTSKGGRRLDDLDLINYWRVDKESRNKAHEFVTNRNELQAALENDPEYLFGVFQDDHLEYNLLADESQPTLEEMTESAIKVLSKSDNGYFLFVEGGRIDHGHHAAKARLALDETVEFSKAIAKASALTDVKDTLIVVTSDHAHTMSISGYPSRGNDILGFNDIDLASDGLPYLTLGYANGPGYRREVDGKRVDISKEEYLRYDDPNFMFQSMVPKYDESHAGDDVGVFARGPWQHLFTGCYEQNLIAHAMAYAMCLGDETSAHCNC